MKKIAGSTHPITHAPHSPQGRYGTHHFTLRCTTLTAKITTNSLHQ